VRANRILILVLTGLGTAVSGAGAWSALREPHPASFASHLVFLLGMPFLALAAGVATRGVEYVRSGVSAGGPQKRPDGWWELAPFRRWLAMRNASAAAWVLLAVAGFFAFVDYFAKARAPGLLAPLVLLVWLWVVARLFWSAFKRTVVAGSLQEARLFIRPGHLVPGGSLGLRVEQAAAPSARRGASLRAVEATLVCDETVTRTKLNGKPTSRTTTVHRQTVVLGRDLTARAEAPARGEGVLEVPAQVGQGGYQRWRVEVRTRLFGPDYTSRFDVAVADDDE
jgi:hypothetical protein